MLDHKLAKGLTKELIVLLSCCAFGYTLVVPDFVSYGPKL